MGHTDLSSAPITNLSPFGVLVSGLELATPFEPVDAAELKSLLHHHGVVVFRGHSPLSDDEYARFANLFGSRAILDAPLEMGPEGPESFASRVVRPDNPEIIMVTNKITEDDKSLGYQAGGPPGLGWHSDYCWAEEVSEIGALDARVVPSHGGETLFANLADAYDALPEHLKARVGTLNAVHELPDTVDRWEEGVSTPIRSAVHPLVLTNPHTGRQSLYVNSLYTRRIVGLPDDESASLLQELNRHCTAPEFVYEHEWQQNDVVIYDQLSLIHCRKPFDESEPRYMRQISLVIEDKNAPWRSATPILE